MLPSGMYQGLICGSKPATKILCWTLSIFLVGAVSSLETDTWLNTFELKDDRADESYTGIDPNLDVTRHNALNREYPSNLHRIKRSPILGKWIKDILDDSKDKHLSKKSKTNKKQNGIKIEDPAFMVKLGHTKLSKKAEKKKHKKDSGVAEKDQGQKNNQTLVPEEPRNLGSVDNGEKQNGSAAATKEIPNNENNTVSKDVTSDNDIQKRIVFDIDKDKSSRKKKIKDGKKVDRIVVDIKKEVPEKDDKKKQNDVQNKRKKSEREPKNEKIRGDTSPEKENKNGKDGKKDVEFAKQKAKQAKEEAKDAGLKAKEAKKEAQEARKKAEDAKKEAQEAKKKAKEAKKEAKGAKKKAKDAKKEAKGAKKKAKEAKKEVKKVKKNSKDAKKGETKDKKKKDKKKDQKTGGSDSELEEPKPDGMKVEEDEKEVEDGREIKEDGININENNGNDTIEVAESQRHGKTVYDLKDLKKTKKKRPAGAKNKLRKLALEEVYDYDYDDEDEDDGLIDDYGDGGITAIIFGTGNGSNGGGEKTKEDSTGQKKIEGDDLKKSGAASKEKVVINEQNKGSNDAKKDFPQNNDTISVGETEKKTGGNKKIEQGLTKLVNQINNQTTPVASSSNSTKQTGSSSINPTTSYITTAKPEKLKPKDITVAPVKESNKTFTGSTYGVTKSPNSTKLPTASPKIIPVNLDNMHYLPISSNNSSTIGSPIKNSTLSSSILPLATDKGKMSSQAIKINSSILTSEPIVIKPNSIFYDARDITYFLESHAAHSVHDPRAYFTEERITRALTIILKELSKMPENLKFAYIVRTLNELGRKIASKLNYLTVEISAILRKTPDDLGNKPDVSMIINTVKNVFESKEDRDPLEETNANLEEMKPIKKLIRNDQEKALIFGQAGKTIADKMAHLLANYVFRALDSHLTNMTQTRRSAAAALFCDALKKGVGDMIVQMDKSDKFRVYMDMKDIFKEVIDQVELELKDVFKKVKHIEDLPKLARFDTILKDGGESFDDLNPISHKTALIGPYNTFLFTNLGSSERVIKLFGSLISRVPPEAKARWINMYESRFDKEYKHTLSGFVTMQGMPSTKGTSENSLLDLKNSSLLITPKLPVAREDYDMQKNKIPARCYLAGRRARLYLKRALKHFDQSEKIITRIANKLSKWKTMLVHQSGNEIYRMCLPRVEVGLRSWGINGDPQSDGSATSKFQMKNPLESLNTMRDPFENGVLLGYRIGAKIGYNEERNATLELEYSGGSGNLTANPDSLASRFIGRAAYRKAATAAAKKAFEISIREGYITALKVSIRAGLTIPAEAGSKMAALKCVSVAAMTGMEVGGSFADEFLINKEVEARQRDYFIKLGKDQGSLAGMGIGEKIGAFVGRHAAEEAYRRAITRGGKLERAKFHLEEFEAGARMGFEYGVMVGKRVASSPNLDPSAPKLLLLPEPFFSKESHHENDVDHWEKDLIPPLTGKRLAELEETRRHIPVEGTLQGSYTVIKETKSLWLLTQNTTKTYHLVVKAKGYIMQNVAYLNLNGTVDNLGSVYGSMITPDVFHDNLLVSKKIT